MRSFLTAVVLAALLAVTILGVTTMIRNSVAVFERNNLAAAADAATPSPDGAAHSSVTHASSASGRIAFAQNGRIAIAMADGTMPTFITDGRGDHSPVWSPDGTKIAFVTTGESDGAGVYVVNADGSEARQVAPAATLYSRVSWSPDSRRLVLRDPVKERQGIYTVDADGSNLQLIYEGNANTPVWSPDGRWIAFTFNEKPTAGGLFLTDPDGADPQVIVPGVFSEVAWSPDSRLLAVRGVPWLDGEPSPVKGIDVTESLLIVERAGGAIVTSFTEPGAAYRSPAWAPDGKTIAFVRSLGEQHDVAIVPTTGGDLRVLASGHDFTSIAWSPDGTELAIGQAAEPSTDAIISLVHADGGESHPFAPGEFPSWTR